VAEAGQMLDFSEPVAVAAVVVVMMMMMAVLHFLPDEAGPTR
jgi:hypothetical protein